MQEAEEQRELYKSPGEHTFCLFGEHNENIFPWLLGLLE